MVCLGQRRKLFCERYRQDIFDSTYMLMVWIVTAAGKQVYHFWTLEYDESCTEYAIYHMLVLLYTGYAISIR